MIYAEKKKKKKIKYETTYQYEPSSNTQSRPSPKKKGALFHIYIIIRPPFFFREGKKGN
jgi:hypothetical protein